MLYQLRWMESSDQAVEVSGQPPFKSPHIHFCGEKKDTQKKDAHFKTWLRACMKVEQ
jgi:hypothetical protein